MKTFEFTQGNLAPPVRLVRLIKILQFVSRVNLLQSSFLSCISMPLSRCVFSVKRLSEMERETTKFPTLPTAATLERKSLVDAYTAKKERHDNNKKIKKRGNKSLSPVKFSANMPPQTSSLKYLQTLNSSSTNDHQVWAPHILSSSNFLETRTAPTLCL
jgi:hypothetical protein